MIRWPIRSARAVSRLFRATQNLDVFVEDQGDEHFYTLLFKRAAPEGVVISRVVGLGGCGPVREAAESYKGSRQALFLIDGDLAWVRGEMDPRIPRLYRLQCYCIENILVTAHLASEVCAEELMCGLDEAEKSLQMREWRDSMRVLVALFARFAVLNKVDPTIATVREGVAKFIVADGAHRLPRLCPEKVAKKVEEINGLISSKLGRLAAQEMVDVVERRISELDDHLSVVSGKDFLLPMLFFHLKITAKTRISESQFRYRLASRSDFEDLAELRRALSFAA